MGRLHCRYNLSGADTTGVRARLDRVATQAVLRAGHALQELLGDTPAVYVLRDVTTQHSWSMAQVSDDELGELWGRGIAAALVRAIASDPGGGANLVQFSDHADFVASFVADLMDGSAWSCWWYGVFAPYAARPRRQALLDVLLEHRAGLAGILAVLHRRGALGPVVEALGEPARRVLWGAPDVPPAAGREAVRPLFAAAVELARALGLWTGRLDLTPTMEHYAASGPRERVWGDPHDLADGVWEAFRWLDAAGALEVTAPGPAGPGGSRPARGGAAGRVNAALAPLDWLDQALLRDRLLGYLSGDGLAGDLPGRPLAPTPRQEEAVRELLGLVRTGVAGLDPAEPASAANALRVYAALVDSAPQFRDDPSIPPLVQRLLEAWSWVAAQAMPAAALDRLRGGGIPPTPAAAVHPAGSAVRDNTTALQFAAGLGASAADLIAALQTGAGTGQDQDSPVGSAYAGVALLLRTVTDLQLSALAARDEFPGGPDASPAALLLALGRRWAGPGGAQRGRVDAGLALLAGLDTPPTLESVGRGWLPVTPADVARFERTWLATLAGQGMLGNGDLHLHLLTAGRKRMVAVAGTAAGLWPLGRLLHDTGELPATLAGWLTAWEAETGLRPPVHCDAALVGLLSARLPDALLVPGANSGTSASQRTNRSAFLRMHRALRWGRTGRPGPDLLVELMAGGLVRLWARWLRGFSTASVPYLLDQLVRRPGLIRRDGTGVHVELDPRPLDVVLEIAHYLGDLPGDPLPRERDVTIRVRRT